MSKAWIENAVIRDIAPGNPSDLYHPEIAKFYDTDVPDEAANGDGWVNGQLVKPPIPEPVEPTPAEPTFAKVSPVEFKLLFTSAERVAIKAARATDPVIDDFYDIVEDPRLTHVNLALTSVQQALAYMEHKGLLAEGRAAEIITGNIQ